MENWKAVKGYEGQYEVSDLGNVRSLDKVVRVKNGFTALKKGKLLSSRIGDDGYRNVGLFSCSKGVTKKVHLLVLEAFVCLRPLGLTGSHLNGDRLDNRLSNLVWEDCKTNNMRKNSHGTMRSGCNHPYSKLSVADVSYIRTFKTGYGVGSSLASKFGVSRNVINNILSGKTYPASYEAAKAASKGVAA